VPISSESESFEGGRIVASGEVLRFLRSNPDEAYTGEEIRRALVIDTGLTMEQILVALTDLVSQRRVESKQVDWDIYYRVVRQAIGFQLPRRP